MATSTPYSTAMTLVNKADIPTWVNEYDAARLSSYALYENIYWTVPLTFKLVQRGSDANPIYIPSGRTIVNTMDRYTGCDWEPIVDPSYGDANGQMLMLQWFTDLFKREKMGSKYNSNKLFGIMKGDWAFYITANPLKPAGRRISITAVDMGMVFPIEDPNDADKILGVDIAEEILIGADTRIKRTRYLKSESPDYELAEPAPGLPIQYQVDAFEIAGWENPQTQKFAQGFDGAVAPTAMPGITNLPIYHIKNFDEPGNPFGSSEMRGLERVMAGINQSVSDEELALALEGLGMYKSSKAAPENGVWGLGPGRVVHDADFERVNGVNTVGPFQEHINYLHGQLDETSGVSDVAKGKTDVTVAESGIALSIRMGPILSSAKKKDTFIEEVMNNFLFDLRDWFKTYEGQDFSTTRLVSRFGQKMPINVKERFDMLFQMYSATPPLITAAYFRDACREMGFDIPIEINGLAIAQEQQQMNAAMDPYGQRIDEEIETTGTPLEDPADAAV